MTTRSKSDKNEVEEQYKKVLENPGNIKLDTQETFYISTPVISSMRIPKQIGFRVNETEFPTNLLRNLMLPSAIPTILATRPSNCQVKADTKISK
jgi:hypothetical protein